MKTLGSISNQRFNNFDFISFFAATMVIISHAFLLSYGDENLEIVNFLTQGQMNAGSLGVYIFFIISGFLITRRA